MNSNEYRKYNWVYNSVIIYPKKDHVTKYILFSNTPYNIKYINEYIPGTKTTLPEEIFM